MSEFETDFLLELSEWLSRLPEPGAGQERGDSWRTAEQIGQWWRLLTDRDPISGSSEDLDRKLVEGWETDTRFCDLCIRPAKYPDRETMRRFWGHSGVVGALRRDQIEQRKGQTIRGPRRLKPIDVSADAPQVFLSHSMADHQFALRIGRALAKRDLRPWLAEEEIKEGDLIIEAVREALDDSDESLVLLGLNALGSAWVETEGAGVPSVVCDGEDEALMLLLESWRPTGEFATELLDPLHLAYEEAYHAQSGRQPVLVGAAGGHAVRTERPEKFHAEATRFLTKQLVGSGRIFVHPRMPDGWKGDERFVPFDKALDAKCWPAHKDG